MQKAAKSKYMEKTRYQKIPESRGGVYKVDILKHRKREHPSIFTTDMYILVRTVRKINLIMLI